ncbi:MAG: DUF4145 domain-containing protein [Candidatus Marinimicrobia bacterium]|nr:DUF4145 domain-containing protein [Candidatus Neomarinimicrobiota bacterium]
MNKWYDACTLNPKKFVCRYCGVFVASNKGYFYERKDKDMMVYICPNCENATYFSGLDQFPAPIFGNDVDNLPQDINSLYNEARACTSVGAYTSSVLTCRKLLMNIAVQKGELQGKSFLDYVEYLSNKGYVPPDGKGWVDQIRKKGNEANHEIVLMREDDAKDLINFLEMLLRFIYEFPSKIPGT